MTLQEKLAAISNGNATPKPENKPEEEKNESSLNDMENKNVDDEDDDDYDPREVYDDCDCGYYGPEDDCDWRQSYRDAFDGQDDAYWNID